MDFLECVKIYANKPSNLHVNSAIIKPEIVNWNDRLQAARRLIIDQLSRLKIEEACLRELTLKNEQNKRAHSTITVSATTDAEDDLFANDHKRFCAAPTNNFDAETINQTELDLNC